MLWPCSSEIDDGLSLARQYGGHGATLPHMWLLLSLHKTCYCAVAHFRCNIFLYRICLAECQMVLHLTEQKSGQLNRLLLIPLFSESKKIHNGKEITVTRNV